MQFRLYPDDSKMFGISGCNSKQQKDKKQKKRINFGTEAKVPKGLKGFQLWHEVFL